MSCQVSPTSGTWAWTAPCRCFRSRSRSRCRCCLVSSELHSFLLLLLLQTYFNHCDAQHCTTKLTKLNAHTHNLDKFSWINKTRAQFVNPNFARCAGDKNSDNDISGAKRQQLQLRQCKQTIIISTTTTTTTSTISTSTCPLWILKVQRGRINKLESAISIILHTVFTAWSGWDQHATSELIEPDTCFPATNSSPGLFYLSQTRRSSLYYKTVISLQR